MKKKPQEMTFKEFFDVAQDEQIRQFALKLLKAEGFTEEEINAMKMEKIWQLMFSSFGSLPTYFEQLLTLINSEITKHPEKASIVHPILKRLNETLKKWVAELEEKLEEKEKHQNQDSS